jgi:hypothetical protein
MFLAQHPLRKVKLAGHHVLRLCEYSVSTVACLRLEAFLDVGRLRSYLKVIPQSQYNMRVSGENKALIRYEVTNSHGTAHVIAVR